MEWRKNKEEEEETESSSGNGDMVLEEEWVEGTEFSTLRLYLEKK